MGQGNVPMEIVELTVPDLGAASDHAVVVSWVKNVGDRVAVDEPICRLAVAELEFEVHSTADGELTRILAQQGTRILEFSSLAEVTVATGPPAAAPAASADAEPLESGGGDPAAPGERLAPKVSLESIEAEPIDPEFAPADPVVERSPRFPSKAMDPEAPPAGPAPPRDEHEVAPAEPDPAPVEPQPAAPGPEPAPPPREVAAVTADAAPVPSGDDVDWSRWISPVVQSLAEEHEIDLAEVRGTGVGGRIRKRDVLRHVASSGGG